MEQRSDDWRLARRGRITGSVVGAVLGHSPFMSKDDVIRSMVREYHGAPSEFVGGPHIDWGVDNEDGAIWQFEMETGLTVEKCGFFPYEDFAGASPDGLIGDDTIFECKAPYSKRKTGDFRSIHEQPHYFDQLQMEMIATRRTKAVFYQWSPCGSNAEYVDFSQDWYDKYMPVIRQAYSEYMSEIDNPEHLEPKRAEVNTQETKLLVDELDQLRDAIAQAEERRKEVEAALVKACGERDAIVWGRKLTRVERAGSISYAKAVKELAPDADLEKWRGKPSTYWKIG